MLILGITYRGRNWDVSLSRSSFQRYKLSAVHRRCVEKAWCVRWHQCDVMSADKV
jgi:hypothetical protein